ncbi:MAG: cyclic nucleotide-binding domain-containing protein [Anaerolineales bacterium]|jgi:CRP-like cAMP-binding protein
MIKQIEKMDIFNGLSKGELEIIAGLTETMQVNKGDALFNEKDDAKYIYILLKGKVRIQVQLSSKPETVAINVLTQTGSLIGWSGLLPGQYYTAAAVCQEDSELLAIEGTKLMHALEEDPVMGFKVMRKFTEVVSSRLRNIQRNLLKTF